METGAKKHTEPDWRGIHPEFQRDAFRYNTEQDHYVCPEGKLLVFGKANKLPMVVRIASTRRAEPIAALVCIASVAVHTTPAGGGFSRIESNLRP